MSKPTVPARKHLHVVIDKETCIWKLIQDYVASKRHITSALNVTADIGRIMQATKGLKGDAGDDLSDRLDYLIVWAFEAGVWASNLPGSVKQIWVTNEECKEAHPKIVDDGKTRHYA